MPKTSLTALDRLVAEAVPLFSKLREAETNYKLTAKAFLAEALALARCNEKRLDELERLIAESPGSTDRIQAFISVMVRNLREATFTRVPRDAGRMARVYGSPEADAQIAQLRATAAEMIAVAVRHCAQKHPDAFGPVEDWDKHQTKIAKLRTDLAALYPKMEHSWSPEDITISLAEAAADRDKGLARIRFRRWSDLHPGLAEWPRLIVEREATRQRASEAA